MGQESLFEKAFEGKEEIRVDRLRLFGDAGARRIQEGMDDCEMVWGSDGK